MNERKQIISRADAIDAGLKRYFTGLPCPRGHIAERQLSNSGCLKCAAENTASWRAANPDAVSADRPRAVARVKAWRKANPEKDAAARARHRSNKAVERAASQVAYRAANLDKVQAARKAYAEANRDRLAAKNRAWRRENATRTAETAKAWRAANPEASRAIVRNRRARLRNAEGTHTKDDILALFFTQKGKCAGCRTSIRAGYHVDHIKPLARGGSNWPRNLQLLCAPCNQVKNAKDPIDWARSRGALL